MLIINKGKKITEGTKEELLNPIKMLVELIADNMNDAERKIRETKWGNFLIKNGNENILLEIDKMQIPELNRTLVEKGINVISLRPKHSLEDFFLSLTGH
jgi:ABC-type multidrug transport system ATPase subunit